MSIIFDSPLGLMTILIPIIVSVIVPFHEVGLRSNQKMVDYHYNTSGTVIPVETSCHINC